MIKNELKNEKERRVGVWGSYANRVLVNSMAGRLASSSISVFFNVNFSKIQAK
jgi:hypothetical protein